MSKETIIMSSETIVMIKPDGVLLNSNMKVANSLYRNLAVYINSQIEMTKADFDADAATLAARHIGERAITENEFVGNYNNVSKDIVKSLEELAEMFSDDMLIPNTYIIIMGILHLKFTITSVKEILLTKDDIKKIYKDKINGHEKEIFDYFEGKKVFFFFFIGNDNLFLLQHLKIFVRRFLKPLGVNRTGTQNLVHVSDENDIDYLHYLMT